MRTLAEIIARMEHVNLSEVSKAVGIGRDKLYKIKGVAGRGLKYEEGRRLCEVLWPDDPTLGELAADQLQRARTNAIEDSMRGLAAMLEHVDLDEAAREFLLRSLPHIAQAAESSRKAGHDVPSVVSGLALHMWQQSHSGSRPQ